MGLHNDGTVPVRWESPDGAADVLALLRPIADRYGVAELTFTAKPGREVMSGSTRIRVDEMLQAGRAMLRGAVGDVEGRPEVPASARRAILAAGRTAARERAAGARGYGDAFYRMVAVEYVRLTDEGAAGRGALPRLAERLAERMGEPEPRHRDNVRDWVAEARRREFLTPVGRGRGGALPGPRLYDEGER